MSLVCWQQWFVFVAFGNQCKLALSSGAVILIGGTCASDVMSLQRWHGVAEVGLLPLSDAARCSSGCGGGCVAVWGSLSEAGAMALWCCRRYSMWVRRGSTMSCLHSLSLFLIPNLLSSLTPPSYSLSSFCTVLSFCVAFLPLLPRHSPLSVSVSLQLCCSSPLLRLVDLLSCMVKWSAWVFCCFWMHWPCQSHIRGRCIYTGMDQGRLVCVCMCVCVFFLTPLCLYVTCLWLPGVVNLLCNMNIQFSPVKQPSSSEWNIGGGQWMDGYVSVCHTLRLCGASG